MKGYLTRVNGKWLIAESFNKGITSNHTRIAQPNYIDDTVSSGTIVEYDVQEVELIMMQIRIKDSVAINLRPVGNKAPAPKYL